MGKIITAILLYLCTSFFVMANEATKSQKSAEPRESSLPDHEKTSETETKSLPAQSISSDALSKEIETRKTMLDWSRHLGVTCNYCHDTNNFKRDDKSAYNIGLKHKNLVRLLNEEVFTERDKGGNLKIIADCYMCHRGQSTPNYKEPPQNLMK